MNDGEDGMELEWFGSYRSILWMVFDVVGGFDLNEGTQYSCSRLIYNNPVRSNGLVDEILLYTLLLLYVGVESLENVGN